MADQNFMDLASKTASGITGTDYMMLVNNSEAYKALVNDVAEAILGKLTSKSFSGLKTTAKNVIGALNELNSKTSKNVTSIQELIDETSGSYTYQYAIPISANASLISEITNEKYSVSGKGFARNDTANIDFLFMLGSGDTIICGRIFANTGEIVDFNEYSSRKYRISGNMDHVESRTWSDTQAGILLTLTNGDNIQILIEKPDQGTSATIRAYWNQ